MRRRRRRRRNVRKSIFKWWICISILVAIFITIVYCFSKNRFAYGTSIQGVNCSFLTVEQATEKIRQTLQEEMIHFQFVDGKQYEAQYEEFDLQVVNADEVEKIFKSQKAENINERKYSLTEISLDEKKLENYLRTISELQIAKVKKPKNAYLMQQSDGELTIVPEEKGNYIEFSQAFDYAKQCLTSRIFEIDFTNITEVQPTVVSTDFRLQLQMEKINRALQTSITFYLTDGTEVVLDKSTMKDWVCFQEDGSIEFDLDTHITEFIQVLDETVSEHNTMVEFQTTGLGIMVLPLREDLRMTLNKEEEAKQIHEELANGGTYEREPIYDKELFTSDLVSYIELDISRQKLWFYLDEECILDTECVTGCVRTGNSTPTGIYFIDGKSTNTYLRGYNSDGTRYKSYVNFWMPFCGGIGLHDASWRSESEYVPTTYINHGSHGCVNLRYAAAQTIFENIDSSIPIIIYAS